MTGRFVVFVPEPFPAAALTLLDDRFEVRIGRTGTAYAEDELIEALAGVHAAAIYSRDRFSARVLANAPRLRVIAKGGSKPTSNVDMGAAAQRGIEVIWTPGANAVSVAEMTIGLMLTLLRRLPDLAARLQGGAWRSFDLLGRELASSTLGLVGFGAVGQEVALRCAAFGLTVLASDPAFDRAAGDRLGVRSVPLGDLLREADIVSLHCEMNAGTANLIDAPALAAMRRGAFLINTARGGLVDEDALLSALDSGQLAGAALDVFQQEPPAAANRLLKHPRVFATPHVAAFTHEASLRESSWAIEDAGRVLLGFAPLHAQA